MTPHALTRRTLLTSTLAGLATATTGCWGNEPSTPPTKEAAIFDLSFTIESRYRPFELVAPAFTAARATGRVPALHRADTGPPAPFCAVEVEVDRPTAKVVAGLASPEGTHLLGFYDPVARRVGIEVRSAGRTSTLRRRRVDLPDAFRLGVALCENQLTVLADTGGGWQPVVTERDKVRASLDLRDPQELGALRYAWGVRGEDGGEVVSVRAGLFGMTGLRDQHLVQHADGTPYVQDGKAYFTATCAGLGFFQQAHWGVFTLDLQSPQRLEQVAQLYFRRDGLLLGDHAGQIVRDDDSDRWIVATSSWGDFEFDGVHVRHLVTDDDVLHGVHVLETVRTPLPTEVSSWDPGMTRIDGRWHVGFVESPSQEPFDFHPALAAGPPGAAWDEKLEMVGAATDLHQCEGPILAQVEGEWWFLASDGDHRHYPVFDLTMRRVGRLDAPYETNIPHPQLVPVGTGEHLLVTFDGTQYAAKVMGYGGHGDVLVMRTREG